MNCSSSLIEASKGLVLDTSVLINLRACRYGANVLVAVPAAIVIPQPVIDELNHERSHRNGERAFVKSLLADGVASVAALDEAEFEIFGQLTAGTSSLGDGEAATIAVAVVRGLLPVIDEKKGRAQALGRLGGKEACWSINLLRHAKAIAALGEEHAIEALYLALRFGRMRIPPKCTDAVVSLLGTERSRECSCLPGYRERFGKSESERSRSAC